MSPPVSVVVPTYRRRDSVARLLRALDHQTAAPDQYEVLVSIDGSEDGTREMVAGVRSRYALRCLWQPNQGRAAACNAGVRAARGDLVVLLDDDMEPAPGFVQAHGAAHLAGPRLGVLGAVPIAVGPGSSPTARYVGAKFNRHLERLARPGQRIGFREFYSGNFSIRRDLLLEVGLFDPAFRVYGNEDGELAVRLLAARVALVFSREAVARQHYEKDLSALARDNVGKGETAVILAAKHAGTLRDLKLATFRRGSVRWRVLRQALIEATRVCPAVPRGVVALVDLVGRWRPGRADLWYDLALDYFFWLGALATWRARPDRADDRP